MIVLGKKKDGTVLKCIDYFVFFVLFFLSFPFVFLSKSKDISATVDSQYIVAHSNKLTVVVSLFFLIKMSVAGFARFPNFLFVYMYTKYCYGN